MKGETNFGSTAWRWGVYAQGCDEQEFRILCALTREPGTLLSDAIQPVTQSIHIRTGDTRPKHRLVKDHPFRHYPLSPFLIYNLKLDYHMRKDVDSSFLDEI